METLMLAATFVLLLGGAPSGQDLRYAGRLPDGSDRGRIELRGRSYAVRAGDVIPGWGRVESVTARELILQRRLSDAEKRAREAEGLFAPDVQVMRIPLASGNLASSPSKER